MIDWCVYTKLWEWLHVVFIGASEFVHADDMQTDIII